MNKILFKLIEGKGRFFLNGDLKNGEIVNPEVIKRIFLYEADWYALKDGDTFDLPEGMGFECRYDGSKGNGVEYSYTETFYLKMKDTLPGYNWKSYIRLLPEKPVQKEESQKDMWMDVFKLVDTNHTIEYLSELFTLKRK